MTVAVETLSRLQRGNERFAAGTAAYPQRPVSDAAPMAVVLGCSDSRVPVETVFDQSIGSLFVVRVAGNVADPSQIGSIEFAVEQFSTSLVVVLGHSKCGAVMASVADFQGRATDYPPSLRGIVDTIRPSVEAAMRHCGEGGDLLEGVVRANVRASMRRLTERSPLLRRAAEHEELSIVGAEYCVDTGVVEFL